MFNRKSQNWNVNTSNCNDWIFTICLKEALTAPQPNADGAKPKPRLRVTKLLRWLDVSPSSIDLDHQLSTPTYYHALSNLYFPFQVKNKYTEVRTTEVGLQINSIINNTTQNQFGLQKARRRLRYEIFSEMETFPVVKVLTDWQVRN